MRLGLVLPTFVGDGDRLLRFARRAEYLGYHGVFAFDHLMPLGGPADGPALECFSALAAVAAATERVAVGTLVARASLRPPGLLAKLAASMHQMARGRLILTIGTGDELSRREHEAFGLPVLAPAERRAQLEETVAAVRALLAGRSWPGADRVPALAGPLLPPIEGVAPRVWVGGASEAAVVSAARLADGWNGWGLPLPTFAERARTLHARGRAGASLEATWGGVVLVGRDGRELDSLVERRRAAGRPPPPDAWLVDSDALVDRLRRLRDAGATWAILLVAGREDRLDVIAEAALTTLADG